MTKRHQGLRKPDNMIRATWNKDRNFQTNFGEHPNERNRIKIWNSKCTVIPRWKEFKMLKNGEAEPLFNRRVFNAPRTSSFPSVIFEQNAIQIFQEWKTLTSPDALLNSELDSLLLKKTEVILLPKTFRKMIYLSLKVKLEINRKLGLVCELPSKTSYQQDLPT